MLNKNLLYHDCTNKIIALLKEENIDFKLFEHKECITSKEAADLRPGYSLQEGCKSLIVKIDNNEFIQLNIPGDKKFNNTKLRSLLNIKKIIFANKEELEQITKGVQPGGIPPFGNIFGLKVYVDKKVLENESIIFNCASRNVSIAIKSKEYIVVVKPEIVDITS